VYKASRRREFERMRAMEEEVTKEKGDKEWDGKRDELKKKDEAKTSKNKAKREKAKARKDKAKGGGGNGVAAANGSMDVEKDSRPMKLGPKPTRPDEKADVDAIEVNIIEEVGIVIHDDD
jgi:Protein of unknown function (DUF1168)